VQGVVRNKTQLNKLTGLPYQTPRLIYPDNLMSAEIHTGTEL